MRKEDTVTDVKNRLECLPTDLERLYDHVLARIDSFYHAHASRLFQIVLQSGGSLSAMQLSFADERASIAIDADVGPMTRKDQLKVIS